MGEFSSQIGVKIAQPPNTEVFLPLSFAELAVAPVHVLGASVMVGWLCGTTPGEPGFSAGAHWDPATGLADPYPLSCLPGPTKHSV